MRQRKGLIAILVIVIVAVLLFLIYQLFRFPTAFRSLSDESLNQEQVTRLRNEIAAKSDKKALVAYDIVFIGYPVWFHATPAPVNSFLESYDLTGKLIIPFCTSGGSDIDETMPTFLDSCKGLAVYGQRRISGDGEISDWLEELDLNLAQNHSV